MDPLNKRMADTSTHGHLEMMDKYRIEFERLFKEQAIIKFQHNGVTALGKVLKNTVSKSEQLVYEGEGRFVIQLRNPVTQYTEERKRAITVSLSFESTEDFDFTWGHEVTETSDDNGNFYNIAIYFNKEGSPANPTGYAYLNFTIEKVTNTDNRDIVLFEG